MTTTLTTERTLDELARADRRCIRTTWTTTLTKSDKYEGEQTILLVLETSHDKRRKAMEVDLYTLIQHDGYTTREFTVFEPSGGRGITIDREPVARFNAKIARELHGKALGTLEANPITGASRAHTDLSAAWEARV